MARKYTRKIPETVTGIVPETVTGPVTEQTVPAETCDLAKVEVIREAHDPKYVAGIRGKRDRYKIGESKAVNLTPGDVPCWAIARDSDPVQSANAYKDNFGTYPLKDKDGNEIRHNELIAMGCPKEEYDAKISEERYTSANLLKSNIDKARGEGLYDATKSSTNKKYFNMGG